MKILVGKEAPTYKQAAGRNEIGSVRSGGTIVQQFFSDETPDGLNFRMLRSHFQAGEDAYNTPRHHHAFQQIRWAQSGDLNFAPGQNIPEGSIAYFPKATWYGPQHKATGVSVAIQLGFHGEQQSGPEWDKVRPLALKHLQSDGVIEHGLYIQTDPESGKQTVTDSVQALFEKQYTLRFGGKWETPREGYATPILMHPSAFEWFQLDKGIECKRLGNFFDHPGPNADVRLAMLRLGTDSTHTFASGRGQIFWSTRTGMRIDSTDYSELTFVYSPRGEEVSVASTTEGLELIVVELPRLD
jgi:hypothetical protein